MEENVLIGNALKMKGFKDLSTEIANRLGLDNFHSQDTERGISPQRIPDLRSDNDLMLRVETLILHILESFGLQTFEALQFPANIRVMSALNKPTPTRAEFSTQLLHCDAWSGHPSDSVNMLLYLHADEECPYMRIFEPLAKDHPLRQFLGSYSDANLDEHGLREIKIPAAPGNVVIWPTYSPHQTTFWPTQRNSWRVSIDVRMRMSNPYAEDPNHDISKFFESKMGHAGLFWWMPNEPFRDIETKIKYELSKASSLGKQAVELRKEYLRRYYYDVGVAADK